MNRSELAAVESAQSHMKIRTCTAADVGRTCQLLGQLWPDIDVNTADMRRCFERGLQSPNQRYICAVLDDEVVGFCSLNIKNNLWQQGLVGHVDELVVDESHRRIGVGSAMLFSKPIVTREV